MSEAFVARADPRFSWELISDEKGQFQTAWQIIVSDNINDLEKGKGNVWNSGKKKNELTTGIQWEKNNLESFSIYYWKVRVWEKDGKVTGWSKPSVFTTGSFDKSDWHANWIGDQPEPPLEYPLAYKHIGYLSSYSDNAKEEKWVQIDLGKTVDIDKVLLYPSYNNILKIKDYYFPLSYRIEGSTDGKTWEKFIQKNDAVEKEGEPSASGTEDKTFRARFVRVVASELKKYSSRVYDYEDQGDPSKLYAFSLAEIEIISKNEVLSKGCAVTFKDALIKIDREDGYDPDMLTDGIKGTPDYPSQRSIPPSPLLRKTFFLNKKPSRALAYVSALGTYEIYFNGTKPDQRVLAPEWTDYNKRVQYQVFDVTSLLNCGENAIGAQLSDGWYAGMLGPSRWSEYFPKRGAYGLDRRLFFQMRVTYPGRETEIIVSDSSWKINNDGPLRMADNFLGESFDARKAIEGWNTTGFDDSSWRPAYSERKDSINLVPQTNQPVRIIETLESQSVTEIKKGKFLFDIGQNIAGWCNINLSGNAGDKIIMKHGEILDDKGRLYTDNLGAAIQTDTVIIGLSGKLLYEPRFTYHGFRYVEVEGLNQKPDKNILNAKVVASDLPLTGDFQCSSPMLNQLYGNIHRSHISNMHGIPTDCPQRDERCGWMGDVFIFAQTSMFNRDMAAFYNKWMIDILDAQSLRGTFPDIAPHPFGYEKHFTNAPGWADAALKLPYLMYINYGDRDVIERNFEAFERYIDNIRKNNPDLIWRKGLGLNYGDWLNGNTLNAEGFPKTGAQIPSEVFSTIMFYNSVNLLSKMATIAGRSEKATEYKELAARIKDSFNISFVDSTGMIRGDAQACYAMALHYGIYTEKMEKVFEKRMIDKFIPYSGRMNTGFHSTLCLMKELANRGYSEKAYELLESKDFPSWGYSIEQGATSIWERWDGYVKGRGFQGAGMNSFNHYAFGSVGEWMYNNILGIQPDVNSSAWRHFILKPVPGGTLTWAKGSYRSISGLIKVSWKKENNRFEYNFTVPPNTTATISIPSRNGQITIDGKNLNDQPSIKNSGFKNGYVTFEINSGTYMTASEL
jgi:alpha-L-rhamnosidase